MNQIIDADQTLRDPHPQPADEGVSASDSTVELSVAQLQDSAKADAGAASDNRRVEGRRAPLPRAHREAQTQVGVELGDATIDFEIPAEWIEPIGAEGPRRSNSVGVFDPLSSAPTSEWLEPSTPRFGVNNGPKTTPLRSIRTRALPQVDCASVTASSGLKPAELRDLDAEGFHVFIARPDANGRVQLPHFVFEGPVGREHVMVLLKAKILIEK